MAKGSGNTRSSGSGSGAKGGNAKPLSSSNYHIGSATPAKLKDLNSLAKQTGVSSAALINSKGRGSDIPTGRKNAFGDEYMANITDAAHMTIKAPEATNFNFGARMFVTSTDTKGVYKIDFVNPIQVKAKQGYETFKGGFYSREGVISQIGKFKKHFGM